MENAVFQKNKGVFCFGMNFAFGCSKTMAD
jgi:hypothetical protein